jgi:hypothetical protein
VKYSDLLTVAPVPVRLDACSCDPGLSLRPIMVVMSGSTDANAAYRDSGSARKLKHDLGRHHWGRHARQCHRPSARTVPV